LTHINTIMQTAPIKITLTRTLLSVIFLALFLVIENEALSLSLIALPAWNIAAISALWLFFALAEVSDILDGFIARKYDAVSDIGKLLDPLADVFSRITYVICFLHASILPAWLAAAIIYRELIIITLRMLLALKNIPLAANSGGKLKTILFAVAIGAALATFSLEQLAIFPTLYAAARIITLVVFIAATCISYTSLLRYLLYIKRNALLSAM